MKSSDRHRARRSSLDHRLAPFNSIVGVASSNVIAYSNGNDSFYSNESHFLDGIYMGLKWQCVEFARRWSYLRKNAIFASVEGAKDMWSQLKYVQRLDDQRKYPLKRHRNGFSSLPHNETFLIYPEQKEMPYGHVAIIVDVSSSSIRIAEQNFNFFYWKWNYAREIPLKYENGKYFISDQYEVYGYLQIIDLNEDLKPRNHSIISPLNSKEISSSATRLNFSMFFFSFFLIEMKMFS